MKLSKLKALIILFVLILSFTLLIFISNKKETASIYSYVDLNKKHLVDLTGDGNKETIEVISENNSYDVKIISKTSTLLLSSLIEDNLLCSASTNDVFKIRFINISRDNKPEILIQGIKNNTSINYIFSYDNNFKLTLINNNNICGVIDSNMIKTPQFITLNYNENKNNLTSNMIINTEVINSTRDTLSFPGIDNIIALIDYINLDIEIDSHPDIFTDTITSKDLSNLWKLDKSTFSYQFKNSFFFDSSIDDYGKITEATYILSFSKENKNDNTVEPFDVEVKLIKSYYNDLRISEMRFFSQK